VDWPLFTRKRVRLPPRRRLPRAIPWEDGRRLLAAIRDPGYRLCCTCLLTWGLRLSDAATLTVQAIDSRQMVVRIISKGNRERLLPLPAALLAALRDYWRTHRHPQWLFPNRRGTGGLDRHALGRAFAAARDACGLNPTYTPHCLRHA
jgi:integrase